MAAALFKFGVIITALLLLLLLLCRPSCEQPGSDMVSEGNDSSGEENDMPIALEGCDYTYDFSQIQMSGFNRQCDDRICRYSYCKAYRYMPQASYCDQQNPYLCCCKHCNLKKQFPDTNCEDQALKRQCSDEGYSSETFYCRENEGCCLDDDVPDLVSDSDSSEVDSNSSEVDPDSNNESDSSDELRSDDEP